MQNNKSKNGKSFFILVFGVVEILSLIFSPYSHADQAVSLSVPPRQADYQFIFSQTDGYGNVPPGTILSYQIEYGVLQSAAVASPTTLTINYSSDSLPNGANLLSYVPGSATDAYNNTQPVINTFNHTITWAIPSLPAGMVNQTVTFQLQTGNNYMGYNNIPFMIRGNMSTQFQVLPAQSITQIYSTAPAATPTPSPTPPAAQSPTPTPPKSSIPLTFTGVTFTGITQSQASIQITTSSPAIVTLLYGLSPTALPDSTSDSLYETDTALSLNNLKPHTLYYLQATAENSSGQEETSNIYMFQTAISSVPQTLQNSIAVVSSGNIILSSNSIQPSIPETPELVIPENTNYTLSISPSIPILQSKINAFIVNSSGQTVATLPMLTYAQNTQMANLETPGTPQQYTVEVQLTDSNGNLIQNSLYNLVVVPPLTVDDQQTGQPLTHARVYLSIFNPLSHRYVPINTIYQNLKNPSYTNLSGEIQVALPNGRYMATVEDLGYSQQTASFIIGMSKDAGYPLVALKNNPFDILSYMRYFRDSIVDEGTTIVQALQALAQASPLLNISALTILAWAGPINFTLFSLKTHLNIKNVPAFLLFHITSNAKRKSKPIIQGTVIDEQGNPLSQAQVEIIDTEKNTILKQISTNKTGHFYLKNEFDTNKAQVICVKEGYVPTVLPLGSYTDMSVADPVITLQHGIKKSPTFLSLVFVSITHFAGSLYEVSLVMSFLVELFSIPIFGITRTLPFILLSLFNWLLWMFYMRERFEWKWEKGAHITV